MFSRDASSLVNQLSEFASLLYSQFPLPFWPAIVWGMYAGWKRNSRMQTLLIVLLATNLIYSLNFSIPDIDNYLLPSVVVILIIGAVGLTDLTTKIRSRFSVAAAIAALLIAWSLIVNWQAMDNSKNYAALDGVHNYYNSVAAPALIFCSNWDYVSPWYYSHYYLKEAPQVLIVDNELLRRSWYFDWLEQTDSSLYEFVRPEYEAFLPHLLSFEAGLPYDGSAIEQAYRALLKKFTNYAGRRFYFEQSVQLSFRLDGQIQVSGKLFHLVREGERFTPPVAEFVELRFGKPEAVLNERELLHLRLFRGMTAIPQQERER
jgi:hypothetical protein